MSFRRNIIPSWQYKQLKVVLNPITGLVVRESLKGDNSVVSDEDYEDYLGAHSSVHRHHQGSKVAENILWFSLSAV